MKTWSDILQRLTKTKFMCPTDTSPWLFLSNVDFFYFLINQKQGVSESTTGFLSWIGFVIYFMSRYNVILTMKSKIMILFRKNLQILICTHTAAIPWNFSLLYSQTQWVRLSIGFNILLELCWSSSIDRLKIMIEHPTTLWCDA